MLAGAANLAPSKGLTMRARGGAFRRIGFNLSEEFSRQAESRQRENEQSQQLPRLPLLKLHKQAYFPFSVSPISRPMHRVDSSASGMRSIQTETLHRLDE